MTSNAIPTAIYCDGYCVVGPDSIGYARITDYNSNDLTKHINMNEYFLKYNVLKPKYTSVNTGTRLGSVNCISVQCTDTPQQQIQYAEITALYVGLVYALMNNVTYVYTDSITANAWSDGRVKAPITDPEKLTVCNLAQQARKMFEAQMGKVVVIEGKTNPADFGKHNKTVYKNTETETSQNVAVAPVTTSASEIKLADWIKLCIDAYESCNNKDLNSLIMNLQK